MFPEQAALQQLTDPSTSGGLLLLVVSGASVSLSVWLSGKVLDRRPFRDFGFDLSRTWWADFWFGLGLGALLMTGIFLVELIAGWVQIEGIFHNPGERAPFLPALAVPLGIFILVGFYEELFNRGYLIKNISEGLSALFPSPVWAVWVASLINAGIFGLLHAGNPNSSLWSTLNISLAGLFLAAGFLLTGQLAIPIGVHISWNFVQGNIFGFPVSGTSFGSPSLLLIRQLGPVSWTGGRFGPEAGLLGTLAMAAGTGLIAAWVKQRTGTIRFDPGLTAYHPPAAPNQQEPVKETRVDLAVTSTGHSRLDLLIWDWNGTLLDDLQLCLEIINNLLAARNLPPVSQKRYLEIFGFPVQDYYQQLGFDFSQEPFEAISTEFITAYEQGRPECQLMDGAEQALAAGADLGLTQTIISASKKDYLRNAVREYGIDHYFRDVLGLNNHHAAGKSLLAADYLANASWQPDRILMIGDTTHDASIAASLGIRCLLIPNGHHSQVRLLSTGAVVIESLLEVPGFINQIKDDK